MKIIISHDVDHLYLTEHLFDGVPVKYAARAIMERVGGVLSTREFILRLGDLFTKRWHHVDELMDFDEANGIPSTFFFAMGSGAGLNYRFQSALAVIQRVAGRGFDCGVHGIEFEDPELIKSEYLGFKSLNESREFGIRMHYLRTNDRTLNQLARTGYLFDSSELADNAPYKIGDMWEFPLHIMDSNEFYSGRSWQTEKTEEILEKTKNRIAGLADRNYPFVTLLFHDRYFCSSHESYKLWYINLIGYLRKKGHSFTGYREAIRELSQT